MLNWEVAGIIRNNTHMCHGRHFSKAGERGVDEEDMGVQLCILSVVVPVCSQPAQAVTGKETFAGVKAAGMCVNDGRIEENGERRLNFEQID